MSSAPMYYWDPETKTRLIVTADVCRDTIAQLEAELDEAAFLPDTMVVGKRQTSRWNQDQRVAARLAVWNARLYKLTGGAEGKPLSRRAVHV